MNNEHVNELHYLDLARTEVLRFLSEDPAYGLYNLSLTDLGLSTAIDIIAEIIEKRVDLGDFEATALDIALDGFRSYLENPEGEGPFGFAQYMASFCLPLIERPDGTVMRHPTACTVWRDGFLDPILD